MKDLQWNEIKTLADIKKYDNFKDSLLVELKVGN